MGVEIQGQIDEARVYKPGFNRSVVQMSDGTPVVMHIDSFGSSQWVPPTYTTYVEWYQWPAFMATSPDFSHTHPLDPNPNMWLPEGQYPGGQTGMGHSHFISGHGTVFHTHPVRWFETGNKEVRQTGGGFFASNSEMRISVSAGSVGRESAFTKKFTFEGPGNSANPQDNQSISMTIDSADSLHFAYLTHTGLYYTKYTYQGNYTWQPDPSFFRVPIWTGDSMIATQQASQSSACDIDVAPGGIVLIGLVYGARNNQVSSPMIARVFTFRDGLVGRGVPYQIAASQASALAAPYVSSCSIARDAGGSDAEGNLAFALACTVRAGTTPDFDKVLVGKISTSTLAQVDNFSINLNTSFKGTAVLSGNTSSNAQAYRKYTLFSSSPGEWILAGVVQDAQFNASVKSTAFVLGIVHKEKPGLIWTKQGNIAIERVVSGEIQRGAMTAAAYTSTDSTSAVGTITYLYYDSDDGIVKACTVRIERGDAGEYTHAGWIEPPNLAEVGSDFTRLASWDTQAYTDSAMRYVSIYSGCNRYFDKINVDSVRVWRSSTGAYAPVFRHNQQPTMPTVDSWTPAEGATITTDIPIFIADLTASSVGQVPHYLTMELSRDAGFTTSLKKASSPPVFVRRLTVTRFNLEAAVPNQLFQGQWYARLRYSDPWGRVLTPVGGSRSFIVSHPPSANPISPTGGQYLSAAGGNVLTSTLGWRFSDPSPIDVQTAYRLIVEDNDTGEAVFASGKVVSGAQSGVASFSTGYLDKLLRWRIGVWDTGDVAGPESPNSLFRIGRAPQVSILQPGSGQVINTAQPEFVWSLLLGGERIQASFRIVVVGSDGSTWDSGLKYSSLSRFRPDVNILRNNTTYSVTLFVMDTGQLSNSVSTVFSTRWEPPADTQVTIRGNQFEELGRIRLTWGSVDDDPSWVAWKVYRRIVGQEPVLIGTVNTKADSYFFDDWTALSTVNYQYSLNQVANRFGTLIESDYTWSATVLPVTTDYWLMHPTDRTKNIRLYNVTGDEFSEEYEQNTLQLIGRGRKTEYGTRFGYTGSLSAQLRDRPNLTARQQRLIIQQAKSEMSEWRLRNPFGDEWKVAMGNLEFTRIPGVGQHEAIDLTIPYEEIA